MPTHEQDGIEIPEFAVLVAAFNAAPTLRDTLDSLIAQTFSSWQAIVVDDGSIDDTLGVAREYASRDGRISVVHQQNQGTGAARNSAAEVAVAPWLVALDADDTLLPEALEDQRRFMGEHAGFDIYSWGMFLRAPDGSRHVWPVSEQHNRVESFSLDLLIRENVLPAATVVSRQLFNRVGGFRNVFLEDYDLWLRAFAAGGRHVHNPRPLVLYRVSQSSKNADFGRRTEATKRMFEDLALDQSISSAQRKMARRAAAMSRALVRRHGLETASLVGDYSNARRAYLAAFLAYYNHIKWLLALPIMLLSPRLFCRLTPRMSVGLANINAPQMLLQAFGTESPSSSRSPRVSVLIVTFNSEDVITGCLRSLEESSATDTEVIVVDNASVDGTVHVIAEQFPDTILVANHTNAGFAAGNNEGARIASGDLLLLLNPDTVVDRCAVQALRHAFQADPHLGVAGAFLVDRDLKPTMSYGEYPTFGWALTEVAPLRRLGIESRIRVCGVPEANEISHDVDYVSGACLMIRREVWNAVGGLDARFFAYFEETNLCHAVTQAGWRVRFISEARVQHLEGASFEGRSAARNIMFHEGLLRYAQNNFPALQAFALRVYILVTNAFLYLASMLCRRQLADVRANRPIQVSLMKLALAPSRRLGDRRM